MSELPWNVRPVLVDKPLVWFRSWRTVISAEAASSATRNHGRYRCTGASSSTFPSSTSCMIASAVNDLLIEPMMKGVVGVTGRPESSALPKPRR